MIAEGTDKKGHDLWYHEKEMGMMEDDDMTTDELRKFLKSIGYKLPEIKILKRR